MVPSFTPNLEKLEISNNLLWFENAKEFNHFKVSLQKFTKLKILGIINNPFLEETGLKKIKLSNIKHLFIENFD